MTTNYTELRESSQEPRRSKPLAVPIPVAEKDRGVRQGTSASRHLGEENRARARCQRIRTESLAAKWVRSSSACSGGRGGFEPWPFGLGESRGLPPGGIESLRRR